MKILADATLPGLSKAFPKPFELTLYHDTVSLPQLLEGQQILICRSTLKVTESLLANSHLRYVATASSGTDHIDTRFLQSRGIKLMDARGSNATAVADYVIANLAFLQQYKNFKGTKAAVIGVGEVGSKVLARLQSAGLQVLAYDPPKSKRERTFTSCSLEAVTTCDLITIHANLHFSPHDASFNLINSTILKKLSPYSVIINASRGGIVNETELLQQTKPLLYCTDVYNNEPAIRADIVNFSTLCTPHIAGHSLEAKENAVIMLSQKLHTAYELALPEYTLPTVAHIPQLQTEASWQDYVLSLYNPIYETEELKKAGNLESAFLSLRKGHQHRHDFAVYAKNLPANNNFLRILGDRNKV
ncbi:NAD(P)-dependent oxidoreductase [Legionella jamestowniensis]|uniref:Erythronate-4-phosphate dehydrogenase n=1 Tax=Legionella jamestowniensis TaxID=455 RepID=A0A0W0UGY5_9GAMM|nr:NAD(P)-dependent oxidoreductase [Legionella jamestowniensis]KTD07172.1 erythronate-4-phosphate dehydrogenase [Legionella jamestowniensis]SFL71893.1 erythronate-4-phosphate dehydrogenase [Legionella jamestowniensis DSM 19215]